MNDATWITVGSWLIVGLVGALASIAWWGFRAVVRQCDEIKAGLSAIGSRLLSIETWQVAHDKQDDERHEQLREGLKGLWDAVKK